MNLRVPSSVESHAVARPPACTGWFRRRLGRLLRRRLRLCSLGILEGASGLPLEVLLGAANALAAAGAGILRGAHLVVFWGPGPRRGVTGAGVVIGERLDGPGAAAAQELCEVALAELVAGRFLL